MLALAVALASTLAVVLASTVTQVLTPALALTLVLVPPLVLAQHWQCVLRLHWSVVPSSLLLDGQLRPAGLLVGHRHHDLRGWWGRLSKRGCLGGGLGCLRHSALMQLVLDCSCARRALGRAGGPLAEEVKVSLVMVGWGSGALAAGAAATATAAVAGACAAVGGVVEEGPAPAAAGIDARRLAVAREAANAGAIAATGATVVPAS